MADLWRFGDTDFTLAGATNVVDLSGALAMPPVRGDNAEIPMREGRPHVEKMFDQRVITLGMALQGSSIPDFENKLEALKLLFGSRTRQYLQQTLAAGGVRRALAEVMKFDPKLESPVSAKMTVDFLLAEPFFRSTLQVDDLQAVSASPTLYTLGNGGNVEDRSAIITLKGPLNYPKLTNLTNGVWVGYNDVIGAGNTVVIDSSAFTCLLGTTNMLNKLVHSGDSYFFKLAPGSNSLRLETLTTGGSVRIQFYPPYL